MTVYANVEQDLYIDIEQPLLVSSIMQDRHNPQQTVFCCLIDTNSAALRN